MNFFTRCFKQAKRFIYRSKGFLTSKNGYIDYKEWHTAVSAVSVMYVSPILWAAMLIHVIRLEEGRMGSFSEYRQEVPYWLMFGLAVGLSTGFKGRLHTALISFVLGVV